MAKSGVNSMKHLERFFVKICTVNIILVSNVLFCVLGCFKEPFNFIAFFLAILKAFFNASFFSIFIRKILKYWKSCDAPIYTELIKMHQPIINGFAFFQFIFCGNYNEVYDIKRIKYYVKWMYVFCSISFLEASIIMIFII